MRPEIVLYIPVGGHPATAGIPRGSAIVGRPRVELADVAICSADAAPHRRCGRGSLADRAVVAGWLLEGASGEAARIVPREALLAVGVLFFGEGRIVLTGPLSVRAVADWLGTPQIDGELQLTGAPADGPQIASVEPAPPAATRLAPELLLALLDRGGIVESGNEWRAADGRRTTDLGDALLWALERIAQS